MNAVLNFEKILNDAEAIWDGALSCRIIDGADMSGKNVDSETVSAPSLDIAPNRIITEDNLAMSGQMLDMMKNNNLPYAQLIYMDPPFYTKTKYMAKNLARSADGNSEDVHAFSDAVKQSFDAYLTELAARIMAARELLGETGCFWLHLDHHAVHYAKVIADSIFGGAEHLVNEVIWQYKSGGATKRSFARKHDTLLFYAKNPKEYKFFPLTEKSYNRDKKPYRFKGVAEYEDDEGWYTIVNMKDVWQIDMVGRTSRERTGYATQKPEALLRRIVEACTEEGDLCIDLYGGSGTLAAAAQKLNRKWITVDENPLASELAQKRVT
jgi:DNA modification methylase